MTHQSPCMEKMILNIDNVESFKTDFKRILVCKNITDLTVQVPVNQNNWAVFSRINGASDYACSFENTIKLVSLPDEITDFKELKKLNVSRLGISHLPDSITKLSQLKNLDVSFNEIDLTNECNKIISLKNLEVIKIYGCKFDDKVLNQLKVHNPSIIIRYSEIHLVEDMKVKSSLH